MMIEGTVEVTGTVKVDSSDELKKLYILARRAKNDDDENSAIKYYDKILEMDPESWEANFYVVYFRGQHIPIQDITTKANAFKNCLASTLTLIQKDVPDKGNQIVAIKEVAEYSTKKSELYFSSAINHFVYDVKFSQQLDKDIRQSTANQCCAARDIMYTLGDIIELQFGDYEELKSSMITAWQKGVEQHNKLLQYISQGLSGDINLYIAKIKKYDSHYSEPTKKKGCYVATCVYGSYDCPEVWTLRRYRDNKLGASHGGRAFIRLYYAISPTLVKWFGNTNWFKKMWRGVLDKKVKKLQAQGYESTPYDDIDWRK